MSRKMNKLNYSKKMELTLKQTLNPMSFPRANIHVTYGQVLVWFLTHYLVKLILLSKIEKVPRGIRGEKSSKDMASSRNLVSTIGALASPKMGGGGGNGTRCPKE